jgi:release factor glutamine methyltransferase
VQTKNLAALLQRRITGEPLPYILGWWEFFGLEFSVSPAVLIPRPETELLVEHALAWLRTARHQANRNMRAADIGTGSGCIAVSLASHAPGIVIVAVDISRAALEVTRNNVRHHQVEKLVQLVQGDLLGPFASQTFDLICANLPYISTPALAELTIFGREPTLALDGGLDGLSLIRTILAQARQNLAPGGLLLLEIEVTQGQAVQDLASRAFPEAAVSLHQDLAGNDRLIAIQNKNYVHLSI